MIRNLIMDMGNVLIRFDPEEILTRIGITEEADRQLMLREIFHAPEWAQMDWGNLTEADTEAAVRARIPERLHEAAHRAIFGWDQVMDPIPGMAGLVQDCKRAGLRIYLLSNASFRQPEYWPHIPGSELFDGTVISAFEHCVKPSPEIYRRLLERFQLKPEECLFVDDMEVNVAGAAAVGMQTFRFDGDTILLRRRIQLLRIHTGRGTEA